MGGRGQDLGKNLKKKRVRWFFEICIRSVNGRKLLVAITGL